MRLASVEASLDLVNQTLDRRSRKRPSMGSPFTGLAQQVRFSQVSFTYPGRTERTLDNTSFVIPKGVATAIIRPSGAGKTTIVNLLLERSAAKLFALCGPELGRKAHNFHCSL